MWQCEHVKGNSYTYTNHIQNKEWINLQSIGLRVAYAMSILKQGKCWTITMYNYYYSSVKKYSMRTCTLLLLALPLFPGSLTVGGARSLRTWVLGMLWICFFKLHTFLWLSFPNILNEISFWLASTTCEIHTKAKLSRFFNLQNEATDVTVYIVTPKRNDEGIFLFIIINIIIVWNVLINIIFLMYSTNNFVINSNGIPVELTKYLVLI